MYLLAEILHGSAGFQRLGGIMRFTHPVNTLKKLGCGLAFGAAAIMAMPTSALACLHRSTWAASLRQTATYYGRSRTSVRAMSTLALSPHTRTDEYTSVESGFEYKSKAQPTATPSFATTPRSGKIATTHIPRLASTRKGVSCSATLSTSYNEGRRADPITGGDWHWRVQLCQRHPGRAPRPARASSSSAA